MLAAYEIALQYAKERDQFGRPIAKFQLVQDLLVKMLGNVDRVAGMWCASPSCRTPGATATSTSALAKAYCTARMRETVGWARELLGGNGIVLDTTSAGSSPTPRRIYSYEGTREMNTLIVGRAITGESAFV